MKHVDAIRTKLTWSKEFKALFWETFRFLTFVFGALNLIVGMLYSPLGHDVHQGTFHMVFGLAIMWVTDRSRTWDREAATEREKDGSSKD